VGAQQLPAQLGAAGAQEQSLVAQHRVPGPGAEPGIAGHHVRTGPGLHHERVGGPRQGGLRVVGRRCRGDHLPMAYPCGGDDLGGGRRYVVQVPGPRGHLGRGAGLAQLGVEAAGVPEILPGWQPEVGLGAVMHPAPPRTGRAEVRTAQAVRPLDHASAVGGRHVRRRTGRRALAVHVTPGAQRLQGQPDRAAGEQPVHDGDRRAAVRHRHLPLDHHVTDPPAPAGEAVDELEAGEQFVPARGDRPVRPFVRGQPHRRTGRQGDHRVQRREGEVPGGRGVARDDQQAVVATGAQAAHRAHRVTTPAVRHQPLAGGPLGDPAAQLGAERQAAHGSHQMTSSCRAESSGVTTRNTRRSPSQCRR
jgi:hypothetical protein